MSKHLGIVTHVYRSFLSDGSGLKCTRPQGQIQVKLHSEKCCPTETCCISRAIDPSCVAFLPTSNVSGDATCERGGWGFDLMGKLDFKNYVLQVVVLTFLRSVKSD